VPRDLPQILTAPSKKYRPKRRHRPLHFLTADALRDAYEIDGAVNKIPIETPPSRLENLASRFADSAYNFDARAGKIPTETSIPRLVFLT
jgi:hypothetical protein